MSYYRSRRREPVLSTAQAFSLGLLVGVSSVLGFAGLIVLLRTFG